MSSAKVVEKLGREYSQRVSRLLSQYVLHQEGDWKNDMYIN